MDIGTINLDNIGSQTPPQRQQHQQRQERQQNQRQPQQQHQRQPQQQHQRQQHQTKNKSPNAFGGPTMSPKFRRWCVQEMIRLSGHDDTTLVDYCFTLQSPAEIRESMSGTLVGLGSVKYFVEIGPLLAEYSLNPDLQSQQYNHNSAQSQQCMYHVTGIHSWSFAICV